MSDELRSRLRVSIAEYEVHTERITASGGSDPDADWWYAAWAEALIPYLRAALASIGTETGVGQ